MSKSNKPQPKPKPKPPATQLACLHKIIELLESIDDRVELLWIDTGQRMLNELESIATNTDTI